jgi:CBS domain containing-hemolysin-like protein
MSKPDPESSKRERNKTIRWVVTIFLVTMLVSGIISLVSDYIMSVSGIVVAFFILLAIIMVGILFDIIGMAVATADEKPFHAMAARKVPGAKECIKLLRNAERVSSICNDVVGDICGVVSGSASATIAAQVLANFELSFASIVPLVLSSLVAALTVGGKAVGKGIAVKRCTDIVYHAGQVIYLFTHVAELFRSKNRSNKKKK